MTELHELAKATIAKYAKPTPFSGFIGRFPRAILAVAAVSVEGCKKHGVDQGDTSYLDMPDAANVLREAKCRHMLKEVIEGERDPEWNFLHAQHEAWNAMARLERMLLTKEEEEIRRVEAELDDEILF